MSEEFPSWFENKLGARLRYVSLKIYGSKLPAKSSLKAMHVANVVCSVCLVDFTRANVPFSSPVFTKISDECFLLNLLKENELGYWRALKASLYNSKCPLK